MDKVYVTEGQIVRGLNAVALALRGDCGSFREHLFNTIFAAIDAEEVNTFGMLAQGFPGEVYAALATKGKVHHMYIMFTILGPEDTAIVPVMNYVHIGMFEWATLREIWDAYDRYKLDEKSWLTHFCKALTKADLDNQAKLFKCYPELTFYYAQWGGGLERAKSRYPQVKLGEGIV